MSSSFPFYIENYCEPDYKDSENIKNFSLRRLIVIHRHGDRTATRLAVGDANENKTCLNCSVKTIAYPLNQFVQCKIKDCVPGDLTEKGFQQLIFLGEILFRTYQKFIEKLKVEADIFFRSTNIGRTKTSLNGLLEGLIKNMTNKKLIKVIKGKPIAIPKVENDSLMRSVKKCPTADHLLDTLLVKNTRNLHKNVDNLVVKMCNRVDINQYKEEIGNYFRSWDRIMRTIAKNILLIKRDFGRFAGELINLLDGPKLSIISAHDTTIGTILTGLKCNMYSHPPYASYIAIEEYETLTGQYIRILFNGNVLHSNIFGVERKIIKKSDFLKYLKFIRVSEKDFNKICN